jgi:hypothetical protein
VLPTERAAKELALQQVSAVLSARKRALKLLVLARVAPAPVLAAAGTESRVHEPEAQLSGSPQERESASMQSVAEPQRREPQATVLKAQV